MGIFYSVFRGSLIASLLVAAAPLPAVPRQQAVVDAGQSKIASLPFDPPLAEPIRYRWEKTDVKDGKTTISWEVSSYSFAKSDEGFRLTVTPLNFGSSETDPRKLAVEQKLAELIRAPFVLELTADGSIVEMENEEVFWDKIITAMEEVLLEEVEGKPLTEDVRRAIAGSLKVLREMPREARLAMLTESIQPALEFGDTEIEMGNPIRASVESASPWGGTVKRDVIVRLDKLDEDHAFLSSHVTLPKAEFASLMKSMVEKLTAAAPPAQQPNKAALEARLGGMNFNHETRTTHQVSTMTGLVGRYRSTETIDVSEGDVSKRRVTSRTLDLVD